MEGANDGAVSPDGSKIAFLRDAYPYTQEIWVVETDGSNAKRVVHAATGSSIASVTWSPTGRRLAYMRFVGSNYLAGDKYTLETADLSGGTPTVLKTSAQFVPALGWAPDRRLLTPTVTIRPANAGTPESGRFVSARSPESSRVDIRNSQGVWD